MQSAMYERMNKQRIAIREQHYKKMREKQRQQFINEMFPIKSQTLEKFWDVRAQNLIFEKDAINQCLRNTKMVEIQHQQQQELVDDLIFLCQHSQFTFTFPFRFHHNEDIQVCNFVCQYFYLLPPDQLDYWLAIMTIEDRKFLYLTFTQQHLRHLTKQLCACIVEDLDHVEAAQLLQLLFEQCPIAVNKRIMNMQLVSKMENILHSKPKDSAYIHITSFIYLRNPEEGFTQHLLEMLFRDIDKPKEYVRAITRILIRYSKGCLNMSLRKGVKMIERSNLELDRDSMDMLIKIVESCRREGTEYTVEESTVKKVREMKVGEEMQGKYNELKRLIIFNG